MNNQIYTLHLEHLKDRYFVGFMMFVLEIIGELEPDEQILSVLIARFRAAYDHMNTVYMKYDMKSHTIEVREADSARNQAFRKLRDAVKWNTTFADTPEKHRAATTVLELIDHFGGTNIPNLGMNAKSAQIAAIVKEFDEKLSAETHILGIGSLVESLDAAQQLFDKKNMERTECQSEKAKDEMQEARRRMSETYRDLVTTLNIVAKCDNEGSYTDFINMLNVEVCHLRTITKQGQPDSPLPSE